MRNKDEEAKYNLTANRLFRNVEELKNRDHEDMGDVPQQKCLGRCP